MHYIDEGPREGPVFVLVHGTPTWSFLYRDVIRELSREARVVALDHIGFGLSAKPEHGFAYTPEAHAKNLIALLDHLELEGATLVVHDLGGPIGVAAALERPARVQQLAVINSFAWSVADDEDVQRIGALLDSGLGRWLYLSRNASPELLLPRVFGERHEPSDDVLRHYTHPFPDETTRTALLRIGQELLASSPWYARLWERRDELQGRVKLLVFGLDDPTFGPDALARWSEAFPAARRVSLAGVGHFPQEEAPLAVVAALRDLLDDDGARDDGGQRGAAAAGAGQPRAEAVEGGPPAQ